jgi:hypothetical protein
MRYSSTPIRILGTVLAVVVSLAIRETLIKLSAFHKRAS